MKNKTHIYITSMILGMILISSCSSDAQTSQIIEKSIQNTITNTQQVSSPTPDNSPTPTKFIPSPSPTPPPGKTITKTIQPTNTKTQRPSITASPERTSTEPVLLDLPEIVTNGDRGLPMVALTFDICEDPEHPSGYAPGIEWYLNLTDTPATFFISGHWMPRNQDIVLRLAENPLFEIGNHSWSHPDFRVLQTWEIHEEIDKTNQTFFEITGQTINLFRFPGGTYYPWILGEIADMGMAVIQWDVVTADPVPDNDAENILKIVQESVQNGSIIIMHANGRGWHTEEALPLIIDWLEEQGYELVTISTLLEASGYNLEPEP